MSRPVLEVTDGGLLTTVQDDGRPDAVHLGVPIGGACDPWSMALANALAGNAPGDAVLELTLAGPTLRALGDCVIGLAGADLEARLDGRRIPVGERLEVAGGQTLAFGAAVDGTGIRTYLAVAGGLDVPLVLGSRSTCLVGAFGGHEGRPLRAGDILTAGAPPARRASAPDRPDPQAALPYGAPIRVVAGPDALAGSDAAAVREALERLVGAEYSVSGRSDRQGLRLEGPAVRLPASSAERLSRGVVWGSIQIPPDGQPICLLADHQTVGGYPVAAVVIRADLPVAGQLGPGDPVSFELVEVPTAQALTRSRAAREARVLEALQRWA